MSLKFPSETIPLPETETESTKHPHLHTCWSRTFQQMDDGIESLVSEYQNSQIELKIRPSHRKLKHIQLAISLR